MSGELRMLKVCPNPKCGFKSIFVDRMDDNGDFFGTVYCNGCGMRGPFGRDAQETMDLWNGLPRIIAPVVEHVSTMPVYKRTSVAVFIHPYTGELVTACRTNRKDRLGSYVVALVVCYPTGDWGVWRFYGESRRDAMKDEKIDLERQTVEEKEDFVHMIGASILEVDVLTTEAREEGE